MSGHRRTLPQGPNSRRSGSLSPERLSVRQPDDPYTTPYYNEMPDLFRANNPIVPGGGVRPPSRLGAPIRRSKSLGDTPDARESFRQHMSDQFGVNLPAEEASTSSMAPDSRGQKRGRDSSPLRRGGGAGSRGGGGGHSWTVPNMTGARQYPHPPDPFRLSEEERQEALAYAHEVYMRRPDWYKRMNPELPGGGFKVPPRIGAPRYEGPINAVTGAEADEILRRQYEAVKDQPRLVDVMRQHIGNQ